jgi:hypothetical protein
VIWLFDHVAYHDIINEQLLTWPRLKSWRRSSKHYSLDYWKTITVSLML